MSDNREKEKGDNRRVIQWSREDSFDREARKIERKERERERRRDTGQAVFPFIDSLVGQQVRTYVHTYNSRESNRTGWGELEIGA